jgi:putative ABC transport system permease protein
VWSENVDEISEQVVVLTRSTNEKLFGDEDTVGETVLLDGHRFRVIGVVEDFNPSPKFYDMTNGPFQDGEDYFIPFSLTRPLELDNAGNTRCNGGLVDGFEAFLASGCTWITYWAYLPTANDAEDYQSFLRSYSEEQRAIGIYEREPNFRLRNVNEWMFENEVVPDDVRVMIWLSLLFLGVCLLNTVGLILTKFQARSPQVALRRALGATRWNILRQNLIEVAAIGIAGGIGGLGLAWLGLRGLRSFFADQSEAKLMQLDFTMVGVAFVVAIIAAVVAGLYPAWRAGRVAPARMLKTQ